MGILKNQNKTIKPYCIITDAASFEELEEIIRVNPVNKEKLIIAIDHDTPSGTVEVASKHKLLINYGKEYDIKNFTYGKGIGYYIAMEEHLEKGDFLIGLGKHITTVGAMGAVGIRVDLDTFKEVMKSGSYTINFPETIVIDIQGDFQTGVTSKDFVLTLIKENEDIKDKFVIFTNRNTLNMADRLTICNLIQNAGVRSVTFSDEDLEADLVYDLNTIETKAVLPGGFQEIVASSKIDGIRVNQVFVGGCIAGNIESMRKIADMLDGNHVNKYVRLLIAPGTSNIYEQMIEEGLVDKIMDSGALIMNQGCSACWAKSQGIVDDNEVFVTTGSFNCENWAGLNNNKIYITSPETAIKAAITGNFYEN